MRLCSRTLILTIASLSITAPLKATLAAQDAGPGVKTADYLCLVQLRSRIGADYFYATGQVRSPNISFSSDRISLSHVKLNKMMEDFFRSNFSSGALFAGPHCYVHNPKGVPFTSMSAGQVAEWVSIPNWSSVFTHTKVEWKLTAEQIEEIMIPAPADAPAQNRPAAPSKPLGLVVSGSIPEPYVPRANPAPSPRAAPRASTPFPRSAPVNPRREPSCSTATGGCRTRPI